MKHIDNKFLRILYCIYHDPQYSLRFNGIRREWFDVDTGMKKRLINPLFFIMHHKLPKPTKQLGLSREISDKNKIDHLC